MKFLIQRVKEASVTVDGRVIGKIGKGLLVFVGISKEDSIGSSSEDGKTISEGGLIELEKHSIDIADKMVKKLIGLRIFEDENGKTNLDIKSVEGQMLIISQFTLYADCHKGNRPSFGSAGEPQMANAIYQYILEKCREQISVVEEGSFGADMKVMLINDGPFTIILDSSEICKG